MYIIMHLLKYTNLVYDVKNKREISIKKV